jgi:predicted extracellular nuclease
VTTDLQGGLLANGDVSYQYSGYWLQEETADYDDNDNTSEGIFFMTFLIRSMSVIRFVYLPKSMNLIK